MEEWIQLINDYEYKVVDRDEVGELLVSTVWLGLDHGFWGGEIPIIFETMIFSNGSWDREYQERYSTLEEAREGHKRALVVAREAQN